MWKEKYIIQRATLERYKSAGKIETHANPQVKRMRVHFTFFFPRLKGFSQSSYFL